MSARGKSAAPRAKKQSVKPARARGAVRPARPIAHAWDAWIEPARIARLAAAHGTPSYVYSADVLRARCAALAHAFAKAEVRYAMKANACPAVLAVLRDAGVGVDAVSPWEVRLARELGFKRKRVIYSGNNPSTDELRELDRAGVTINVDSLSALERLGAVATRRRVSLRVNPDVGDGHHPHVITAGPESKFGLAPADLPTARKIAARHGLRVVGLHQHIGSGLAELELYVRALEPLARLAPEFPDLEFVDIGGGFGVPYRPEEAPLDLPAWGRAVEQWHAALESATGRSLGLLIEPGRYLVAEAGVLVTRVTTVKRARDRVFVGVDSGMHHLVRPAMYGSFHPLRTLPARTGTPERCTVVGPICESGDVLASDRTMVPPREGDLLVVGVAGAYGYAMASQYNLRGRPAEILLDGAGEVLARPRERYRDLVRPAEISRFAR